MRQVLSNVEARQLTEELKRRGIPPHQRLRVVIESLEQDAPAVAANNGEFDAFRWLADESNFYSDDDLVERHRE